MANAPVPVPRNFGAGETETGSFLNSLRDALNFLLNPPIAAVFQTTVQTLTTGTFTAISFDSSTVDTYGGHSNSTNNTRYTAQVTGWHLVSGQVCFVSNATGARQIYLAKNGTQIGTAFQVSAATNTSQGISVSTLVFLSAGDYVEVQAWQNSGGNLNTLTLQSGMTVTWVHA